MAERRMFAKSIVLSDAFLDMPLSARCLYFTLGMFADDDGFVGSPKGIMRQCGASQDDMAILLQKRFVLGFDSGVIVIKHWRINNYLRSDRYQSTTYLEEKETLTLDDKNAYTEKNKEFGIPNIGIPSIDKDSIGKDSINNNKRFTPPTIEEVRSYCQERNNNIDPETFINFYESKGWYVGKNKMKDWRACVRTWEKNRKTETKTGYDMYRQTKSAGYDFETLERESKEPKRQHYDFEAIDKEIRAK